MSGSWGRSASVTLLYHLCLQAPPQSYISHFLYALTTKSCFLHRGWDLSTRPPANACFRLRCVKQSGGFVRNKSSSRSRRAQRPASSPVSVTLPACTRPVHRAGVMLAAFIVRTLSCAAVYKGLRAPVCASVYTPVPLIVEKRVLGHCCRAFHTDNMMLLNTAPT
ncbi:unnamed protein product [Pleuronectes platessa]|uniref:Uncharacterized protein n=1 Tax=Pleuronectes platessa TaxID=8262 RepID=A0A9N7YQA2_PLEPL|nr:unnamed protein product [Pleuronectes platessa]